MADQLQAAGVDLRAWLALAGVSASVLEDPAATVSAAELQQLLREALWLSREPALGLLVGARLQAHAHGVLGLAALTSASVGEAIALMQRYLRLRMPLLSLSTVVSGEWLQLQLQPAEPLGDLERALLEATLMAIKNLLDALALGPGLVRQAAFRGAAPEYQALARSVIGCPVHYGQSWNGIAVPRAALDQRLQTADPAAFAAAAEICRRELDKQASDERYSARVRRLLLQSSAGFPTLAVCARLLHLTPRTLHRRLVDEGSSFQQVLDQLRHTLAVEQLRSGRIAIEAIAYGLGYTDLANFRRAFRRWEGVPPAVYRKRLRAPEH